MVDVSIRFSGLRELRAELRRLEDPKYWARAWRDAGKAAADVVAERARQIAPRLSGRLAGSIRPLAQATRAQVAAGNAKVPYAGPTHFGWPARGIGAQPFITDAAQQRGDEIVDKYLKAVDDLTRRAFPD